MLWHACVGFPPCPESVRNDILQKSVTMALWHHAGKRDPHMAVSFGKH
jgi:hypothetical protein